MNEDRSEDDIDISQISKENEINNSFSSKSKERNDTKQRLNTSGSNFIVTMAQSHNVNRNITDIDMIKGNFLLKKAPFNYIQNPDIKMISVDGVEPTVENIKNGLYSITTNLYAVTYENNPNENVEKLIDWVLSDEGQSIIEQTGYVGIK